MKSPFFQTTVLIALLLFVPLSLVAQNGDLLNKVSTSGFVDFYYGFNLNQPASKTNSLHLFDLRANEIRMSLTELVVQQQAKPVGFRIDLDFGPTNDAVHYLDAGTTTNFLQQAYVTTVLSLGKGLTLDIGKFVTHMGYEVIESKDNWNYTRSILFGYAIPFFHTGARASYPVIDDITLTGYIYNGWDRGVTDNNTNKTFGGTVNIAAIPATSVILNWIGGPELDDGSDQLHVFDIILNHTLNEQISIGLNADYGSSKWEGGTSVWKGAALYGKTLVTDLLTVAARAEYFVDQNGVRTGAIQDVKELTLTFEYKFLQDLLTRFEIRRDVCTIPFFENKHIQDTFLLGTIVSF